MSNTLKLVLVCLILAIVGCEKNTTDEYLQGSRCIEGTQYTYFVPMIMSCGANCTTTYLMPMTGCSYESYTYRNPDYIAPAR